MGSKILFIGWLLFTQTKGSVELRRKFASERTPKVALHGHWEVEEFVKNRELLPVTATDPKRWRQMSVYNAGMLLIRLMNYSVEQYKMEYDPTKKTITLSTSDKKYVLATDQPDPDHLIVDGGLKDDSIRVRLRKIDSSKFLLVNRGFHWINEVPYNR